LSSSSPSAIIEGLCVNVNISGWHIGTGADIISVTLNGVEVSSIVEQTTDNLRVVCGQGVTAGTGDIVVTTTTGEVTTLEGAFSYEASSGSFTSGFESGPSAEWIDTGDISWQYVKYSSAPNSGPLTGVDGTGQFAKLIASGVVTTERGVLTATYNQDSNCVDTVAGFSFYYHLYSQYQSLCQGSFIVQALMDGSADWVTILSPTAYQSNQDDPWIYETYTFANPTTVKGIRFVGVPYTGQDACRWWYSVQLDEITVDRSSSCANNGCPGSAAPTIEPVFFDWARFNESRVGEMQTFRADRQNNLIGARPCRVLENAERAHIAAKSGVLSILPVDETNNYTVGSTFAGYTKVMVEHRPVNMDRTFITIALGRGKKGANNRKKNVFLWNQPFLKNSNHLQFRTPRRMDEEGNVRNQAVEFVWLFDTMSNVTSKGRLQDSSGKWRKFPPADDYFLEMQLAQGGDVRMCFRMQNLVLRE